MSLGEARGHLGARPSLLFSNLLELVAVSEGLPVLRQGAGRRSRGCCFHSQNSDALTI